MPNLQNDWEAPTNIPENLRNLEVTDDIFGELLSALASADTLSQAESAVDAIFEPYAFLESL